MKFGKIYTEWLTYLKKKGLYTRYMLDYARTNEYLRVRNNLIESGDYWRYSIVRLETKKQASSTKFFRCEDQIMPCTGESMTIQNLIDGAFNLGWYKSDLREYQCIEKMDWAALAKEFGKEYGYIEERPRIANDFWSAMLWDDDEPSSASVSTARIAESTRIANGTTRYEEAHTGQWYDRYYGRGRNINNRNNNRWRR